MSRYLSPIELRRESYLSIGIDSTNELKLDYSYTLGNSILTHNNIPLIEFDTSLVIFKTQIELGSIGSTTPVNGMLQFDGNKIRGYQSGSWDDIAYISDVNGLTLTLDDITNNGNMTTNDIIIGTSTKNITLTDNSSVGITFSDNSKFASILFDEANDQLLINKAFVGGVYVIPTSANHYIQRDYVDSNLFGNHSVTELNDVTDAGSGQIVTDTERTDWNAKIDSSEKGVANGVATLDAAGKVPESQLPDSVIGGLTYKGTWDANANSPDLSSLSPNNGDYYKVSVAGSTNLDGITDWKVGDWAIYQGTSWEKIDQTETVTSVNGLVGAVVLTTDDIATANDKLYTSAAEQSKLSGIEAGAEVNVQSDWNAVSGDALILNKPSDLTDLSTHSVTELNDITDAGSGAIITTTERTKLNNIADGAEVNVQSDWNQTTNTADDYIKNKPEIVEYTIDTLTTSDTSTHVISTITPETNKTSIIKVNVTGFGNGEWAGYVYNLIITRDTGAPVIQLENEIAADDSFGWTNNGIQFAVSGNDITVSVKSDNAVSIDWVNKYSIL